MTESRFKTVVVLLSVACLATALLLLVRAFWPAAVAENKPAPTGPTETAPETKAPSRSELTRTILSNDLFGLKGQAGPEAAAAPPKPAEIDMELAGTVVSADPRRSVAFLRDKATKAQKPYSLGASIKDARIKKIGRNFVILERQGREEILTMKP